jgi:hypothetical protein
MQSISTLESKVLSIWYQILSYILGIVIALLISSIVSSILIKFVQTPKPFFQDMIKWAFFLLIFGTGLVKIKITNYGLLTIFGRRRDDFFLSEGWWWLPPLLVDFLQFNKKIETSIIEISDIFSGGNEELHNQLPKKMYVKIGLNWVIIDPILFENRSKSAETLQNRFKAATRNFVSRNGNTVQSLIKTQDELKFELVNVKTYDLGILIEGLDVINISGSEGVMLHYENLYNKIIEQKLDASKIYHLINDAGLTKEQAKDFILSLEGKIDRKDFNINLNNEIIDILKKLYY